MSDPSWDEAKQKDLIALNKRFVRVMFLRSLPLLLLYLIGIVTVLVFIFAIIFIPLTFQLFSLMIFGLGIILAAPGVSPFVEMRTIDAVVAPSFHAWFTRYGIEATATVIWREDRKDQDGNLMHRLEFAWHHPETQQRYTKRVSTSKENYDACPLESTHPVLFDPTHPDTCQFYRSQVQASEIIAGYLGDLRK